MPAWEVSSQLEVAGGTCWQLQRLGREAKPGFLIYLSGFFIGKRVNAHRVDLAERRRDDGRAELRRADTKNELPFAYQDVSDISMLEEGEASRVPGTPRSRVTDGSKMLIFFCDKNRTQAASTGV